MGKYNKGGGVAVAEAVGEAGGFFLTGLAGGDSSAADAGDATRTLTLTLADAVALTLSLTLTLTLTLTRTRTRT